MAGRRSCSVCAAAWVASAFSSALLGVLPRADALLSSLEPSSDSGTMLSPLCESKLSEGKGAALTNRASSTSAPQSEQAATKSTSTTSPPQNAHTLSLSRS